MEAKNKIKRKVLKIQDGELIKTEEEKRESDNQEVKNRFLYSLNLATELGFVISLPIVGGVLLGSYLDKRLATTPKLTLSLIFFGTILALFNVYKILQRYIKD